MSDAGDDLDRLGLFGARPFQHQLLFGKNDAHSAMRGAKTSNRINKMPVAHITLDRTLLPPEPIDYLAPLIFTAKHTDFYRPLFTGSVVKIDLDDPDLIGIEALGGRTLMEAPAPVLQTSGVHAGEIAHLLARTAGMGESQISVEGVNQPDELFEIVIPIDGARVADRVELGSVTLVGHLPVRGLSETHRNQFPDFFGADSYAVTFARASRIFDAEERGLHNIELAAAWLLTLCRYGLATLPDGALQAFDRERAIAVPRIREVVFVRGLGSQRRWLRSLTTGELRTALATGPDDPLIVSLPSLVEVDEKTRQAILALARAAREREPIARVSALWEAVEFYVGSHQSIDLFTSGEKRKLRKAIPDWLTAVQRGRLTNLINDMLNSMSLRQRLREVLDEEGVPWSEGDLSDLFALRDIRNKAQHGQGRVAASEELLTQATSFIARMLIHRAHRLGSTQSNA